MYIFEKYLHFRHLKLEIALAIPASNDEKYNWNNSAGQGLKWDFYIKRRKKYLQITMAQNDIFICKLVHKTSRQQWLKTISQYVDTHKTVQITMA